MLGENAYLSRGGSTRLWLSGTRACRKLGPLTYSLQCKPRFRCFCNCGIITLLAWMDYSLNDVRITTSVGRVIRATRTWGNVSVGLVVARTYAKLDFSRVSAGGLESCHYHITPQGIPRDR